MCLLFNFCLIEFKLCFSCFEGMRGDKTDILHLRARKYQLKKLSSGFTFLFRSLNSKKFRQNLASMVMNNENMGLSQQVLVLLESTIHLWREHEFQGKGPF